MLDKKTDIRLERLQVRDETKTSATMSDYRSMPKLGFPAQATVATVDAVAWTAARQRWQQQPATAKHENLSAAECAAAKRRSLRSRRVPESVSRLRDSSNDCSGTWRVPHPAYWLPSDKKENALRHQLQFRTQDREIVLAAVFRCRAPIGPFALQCLIDLSANAV